DLSLERDNLKNEYIDLRDENSYLLLRNSDLTDLSDAYLNYSDELNEIIDQFKDIPGTPAVSDLDYALYGGR
ncbi:MAG: hypothetical protein GTO02_07930, partial [Candidatus Dadabacteria bacterium]|nr:hypothetical protein [Candidatus Dadabacteria bacterium]